MTAGTPLYNACLLAADATGRPIVSVHTKRTYTIAPTGRCSLADEQVPLLVEPIAARSGEQAFHETDIVPFKSSTDVIVIATAHGKGRRHMTAGISIDRLALEYHVTGDRVCQYRGAGRITFSDPAPIEEIPLRYENAYGGFDATVPPPEVSHIIDMLDAPAGLYPRNPVGRGFVCTDSAEAIEGLRLPNVEHPRALLTPTNLVTRAPELWWRQPLAWSCDWFGKSWYPRSLFYGSLPETLPEVDDELPEVAMRWVEPRQKHRFAAQDLEDVIDPRIGDAASPALVRPLLRGAETVVLRGMTPGGLLPVALPADPPRVTVLLHRKHHELVAVPHRVLISTEEMALSIVWHAALPMPETLVERANSFAAEGNPVLPELDVFVDGRSLLS